MLFFFLVLLIVVLMICSALVQRLRREVAETKGMLSYCVRYGDQATKKRNVNASSTSEEV